MTAKRSFKSYYQSLLLFYFIFFIAGCKKDSAIVGVNTLPERDRLNLNFTDTISVFTHSIHGDSVRSDETAINLLGSYNDPVFGKTSASVYTQLRIPENLVNINFGDSGLAFDSLVLILPYSLTLPNYYGLLDQQTFKVFKLTEDIYLDSSYFSNKKIGYESNAILGSVTFTPKPSDSVLVDNAIERGQLRIRLPDTLGVSILNQSSTSTLANNTNFLNFLKGIYITPDNPAQVLGGGAILNFNLTDVLSGMRLYYRTNTQAKKTKIDTLSFLFEINPYCARIGHFTHDYSSTVIQSQLTDSLLGNNLSYLQSLAGSKIRIRFPFLKNISAKQATLLAKAELVIKTDGASSLGIYSPIPQLELLNIDSTGNKAYLIDEYEGPIYFGGSYNSTNMEYRFNITRHVQRILSGKEKNNGLVLISGNETFYPSRSVINGGKNMNAPIRLKLSYIKP